jgi:hypothetical protein
MLEPRHPPRPSLDRQPTVIDLTDDRDRAPSQSRRSSQRATLPPQLERSDFTALEDVISIESDDDDDEIRFVGERTVPSRPSSRPSAPPSRLRLPRPPRSPRHARPPRPQLPSILAPRLENPRAIMENPNILFGGLATFLPNNWRDDVAAIMFGQPHPSVAGAASGGHQGHAHVHLAMGVHPHQAFARAEPRKAEHVPPPRAREGFTRSPKEEDVVVCPACEEELMVAPEEPAGTAAAVAAAATTTAAGKPAKVKVKSKKDREEHPFWVVRECGHVSIFPSSYDVFNWC